MKALHRTTVVSRRRASVKRAAQSGVRAIRTIKRGVRGTSNFAALAVGVVAGFVGGMWDAI